MLWCWLVKNRSSCNHWRTVNTLCSSRSRLDGGWREKIWVTMLSLQVSRDNDCIIYHQNTITSCITFCCKCTNIRVEYLLIEIRSICGSIGSLIEKQVDWNYWLEIFCPFNAFRNKSKIYIYLVKKKAIENLLHLASKSNLRENCVQHGNEF